MYSSSFSFSVRRLFASTAIAVFFLGTGIFTHAEPLLPVSPIPSQPGEGLAAQFWAQPAKSLKSLGRQGLEIIRDEPANATFLATTLSYAGNDLLRLEEWLGDDADSLTYHHRPDVNVMGDALLRLTGYIAITATGKVNFRSSSDDGSIVWIGGRKVIHNDGYGAAPGSFPEGAVSFERPGLYPIEIVFFNGDWTDDAGNHGESILRFFVEGKAVTPGILYSQATLGNSLSFPTNPHTAPNPASPSRN